MTINMSKRTLTASPRPRRPLAVTLLASCLAALCSCSDEERGTVTLPSDEDRYAYSVAVAERARQMLPKDTARALYNLAQVHHRFGMDETALPLYERALELNSNFTDAHVAMGNFYSETNRSWDAIRAYQLAIRTAVKPAGLWTRIGLVFLHMEGNHAKDALEVLETEKRAGSATALTHLNVGLAHKALGDWAQAAKAFRTAVDVGGEMREAVHGLSEALRLSGEKEEAKVYLEKFRAIKKREDEAELKSRSVDPDNRALQKQYVGETWYDAAVLFLDERLRLLSSDEGKEDSARLNELRGWALEALAKAVEYDPSARLAHDLRIQIIGEQSSGETYLAALKAAVAGMPHDARLAVQLAELHLERAKRFRGPASPVNSKRPQEELLAARRVLEDLVARYPELGKASGLLAELYVRHFSREAAIKSRAVELAQTALDVMKPPVAQAYDVLAGAHMMNGSPSKALETLRQGLATVSESEKATLRNRIGQVERMLKSRGQR